jgi:protein-disulfide isomerase/uncharacterized membrane protein
MTATETTPGKPKTAVYGSALVAAFIGAALSAYLGWVHLLVKLGEDVAGLCNLSAKVNCNVAAGSVYSEVGGVPIAVIGLGFYVATFSALVVGRSRSQRLGGRLLVMVYAAACVYSLFLAGVSAFVLGSFCWACSGTYLVNIALLILCRALSDEPYIAGVRRVFSEGAQVARSAIPAMFVFSFSIVVLGAHFSTESLAEWLRPTPEERNDEAKKWVAEQYLTQPQMVAEQWATLTQGPAKGPADACVTLVEFSDFQCPHCSKVVPTVKRLLETYPASIRVVFRHNPLGEECNPRIPRAFHPRACAAAKAAICAHVQGSFWKMHDKLFENQQKLGDEDILRYAQAVGLGRDELAACVGTPAAAAVIARDLEDAAKAGVRGTPALFVNGRRVPGGAATYPQLAAIVAHEVSVCAARGN